jgi:hypothetical protein
VTFQLYEQKSQLTPGKTLKKFRFYNKNLALDLKIFRNKRLLSVCFQQNLTLMLKTIPDDFQLDMRFAVH